MKKTYIFNFIILLFIFFLITSCSSIDSVNKTSTIVPSQTTTLVGTNSPSPETRTPSSTPTDFPTQTPTPIILAERIPIIEYHDPTFRLGDEVMMTAEWFEDQMKFLSDHGYQTLNSEQLVDFLNGGAYPQKSVVLSFDIGTDRRKEYVEVVIPALRKYGFTAVVFLVSNTNLISDDCNKGNTFCWSELKNWSDEGLISVESHGIWHLDYKGLDIETQKQDLSLSKDVIEKNIGKSVLGFAFPFDSVNPQTNSILKSLGYQFAVGGFTRNDRSMLRWDNEPFNLPRVYPYSNPDLYPGLSSSSGMTFGEMIIDQTSLIGRPTPTSNVHIDSTPTLPGQISPTPKVSISPPNSQTTIPINEYESACSNIDRVTDTNLRIYQLNSLYFDLEVSPEVQAAFPFPMIRKPSCNFRPENNPIAIVLHTTRGSLIGTISTFQTVNNTSAHYIIDRDGSVIQVLPENLGAFHVSCYGNRAICVDTCPICNDQDGKFIEPALQSIGIELVNGGTVNDPNTFDGPVYEDYMRSFQYRYWEDFPEAQIQSLILLVNDIRKRWNIPLDMVMGHYRINTNTDPGPALNLFWDRYGNPFRKAIFPPE